VGVLHCENAQNAQECGIGAAVVLSAVTMYIAGKIDQSNWLVVTGTGAIQTALGVAALTSITHPFASQSAFEAGIGAIIGGADFVAQAQRVNGVCYCESVGNTADNTSMTYNGWTGSETYSLRVWTTWDDAFQSNRIERNVVNGTWDATRYRHQINAVANNITASNDTNWLIMIGIQIRNTTALAGGTALLHANNYGAIRVIGCYFVVDNDWADRWGIRVDGPAADLEIWHCLMIMLTAAGGSAAAIRFQTAFTGEVQVCFSTVYGWVFPLRVAGAIDCTLADRNNGYIGNTNAFPAAAGLTRSHDYNVYDINENETHGFLTAQADGALFTAVAGGRETWDYTPVQGSDLIYRGQWENSDWFHADFEHDAQELPYRIRGLAPDCGCIERNTLCVPMGVCPNCPANIETGTANVTTLNGVATFDIPQIHSLMGVGARLTWGANAAYISGKISPLEWTCIGGAGGVPPNATAGVTAIAHPYGSQSAAEAGAPAIWGPPPSLVVADINQYFPCYCEQVGYTVDGVAVTYDGITCDRTHRIYTYTPFSTWIESNLRHSIIGNNGAWDATRYRHEMGPIAQMVICDNVGGVITNVVFRGIQTRNTNVDAVARSLYTCRPLAGGITHLHQCVLGMQSGNAVRQFVRGEAPVGSDIHVENTVCVMLGARVNSHEGFDINSTIECWFFNNGLHNVFQSIDAVAAATVVAEANWLLLNDVANAGVDTSDYNLYRENDEGDANGVLTTQTDGQLFNGYNAANPELSDWRPGAGSDLVDNGVDATTLAGEFAWMRNADLNHPYYQAWRPQNITPAGGWDIGPLERGTGGFIDWGYRKVFQIVG
jgi:hypothetical protein